MDHGKAVPSKHLVQQPTVLQDVYDQIALAWGLRHKLTHNPAPNPVSLHRNNIADLLREKYVVSNKADGVRYLLVMGRRRHPQLAGKHEPYAVMVDRTLRVYQLQIMALSPLFRGSVFDGELVWNQKTRSLDYLVFDAVASCGVSLRQEGLGVRYRPWWPRSPRPPTGPPTWCGPSPPRTWRPSTASKDAW